MRRSLSIDNVNKLPKTPGVYFLKNKKGEIFYIGKANNLRARAHSHKNNPQSYTPENIHKVEYIETANEIEALLKESEYIKKYDPKMNYRLRDDKKYFYVGITKEELPRVFTTHQPLKSEKLEYMGPFTDGEALKITMKYMRKIFPYYTTNSKRPLQAKKHSLLPCSWCHLKLCPGSEPNKTKYRKNIRRIKNILQGRQKNVIADLRRTMKAASAKQNFEKAQELKDALEALENIFEHRDFVVPWDWQKADPGVQGALGSEYLMQLVGSKKPIETIEGYDISNIQGKEPTASMVRFKNGMPDKSLYRKFNITSPAKPNDYLMMQEVVTRRLKNDWPLPDMFLVDGGRGQLNVVLTELRNFKFKISNLKTISNDQISKINQLSVVSLAKKEEELYLPEQKNPIPLKTMPQEVENLLRHVRDEAHRFAISHHRARHRKKSLS